MDKFLVDNELGNINVRLNNRSKHIIFRVVNNEVVATIPSCVTKEQLLMAIKEIKPKLLKVRLKYSNHKVFNWDYFIRTDHVDISFIKEKGEKFFLRQEKNRTIIICPSDIDFEDKKVIAFLKKVIIEIFRKTAKVYLPRRLKELSLQTRLSYNKVYVKELYSRWGSCSNQKNINLSLFLMLLPDHLIDYVLLHELTHTKEMNHGACFWSLLNNFTNNKALSLREELNKYKDSELMMK